ncbi:MAG: TonB-dependent receptor [Pedobacter sp.]|nr:MAG: TonB-dependent receptor [Pedobacter sp.]
MKKICLGLLVLVSANLYAQDQRDTVISIDQVIINENRFSTPISKQNRNVYIIDKAMIAKLPGRTLQELLQYANGVDIRQRGPFGSQADISIDGGSFEQTVVLLNGTKIIDTQTAHNMLNLPIPVEAIERIEIIRGPAARIYGINSLTGAINIITKKPANSGVLLNTYAGSNFEKDADGTGDTFSGRGVQLGAALSKANQQHTIFGAHDKSNGYRFNTGFENNKLFYQGAVQLDKSNEITGSAGYIRNGFGANGFYAAPGDRNSTEIVQTTIAAVQSKHELSERFTLIPRVSYRYNDDDYRYFGNANLNAGRSRHYTTSLAAEINTTYKLNKGELGFGVEGRTEDIKSSNIGKHDRENLGIYAQYRTYLLKNLNVNLGTYINYNSDYKWQMYPGLDASYALSNKFTVTGNIGTSQRIPSFTDLYLNQRPGNIGNPDLKPENAFQSELGLKFISGNFSVHSAYFYREISKFIDWTKVIDSDPWQSNNVGDQNTNGFNIRSNYAFDLSTNAKFNINLAYSYLDTEFSGVNPSLRSKYLISSLKHQLNNTVDFRHKGFNVLFSTRLNERISGSSYWINDIRLSQSVKKITVFADAQNIFDTTYFEIGAIPLPSKWFSLGIKYTGF